MKDQVDRGLLIVGRVDTKENTSDVFTKSHHLGAFERARRMLNIVPRESLLKKYAQTKQLGENVKATSSRGACTTTTACALAESGLGS